MLMEEETLDGSGLKPENVSHTLLVGGSTRIPINKNNRKGYEKTSSKGCKC